MGVICLLALSVSLLAATRVVNSSATSLAPFQIFVVTNTSDNGPGTLRQAILDANTTSGSDNITFSIPGSGIQTINLLTALPDITDPVNIDATTQPGFSGQPLIELNGFQAGSNASGFSIVAGGSTVRGFVINRFRDAGITLRTNGNNVIQGNYIGTNATGTAAQANTRGIKLVSGSSNNIIGGTTPSARNIVSGNTFDGLSIIGSNNQVTGNFIGTNVAGTSKLGNGTYGIEIFSVAGTSSENNQIGGTASGAGNLISGNPTGIRLTATSTVVQGNLIGTDASGTVALGNNYGIWASSPSSLPNAVLIGGTVPAARNVISGNLGDGVQAGRGTTVQGNFIGTDITGTQVLGNLGNGVLAGDGALIGGVVPGARNVISGNGVNSSAHNISIGPNSSGSQATVQGNYIGTDVSGHIALQNGGDGIYITSINNVIGGTEPGAANVISGNHNGIRLGDTPYSGAANGNTIKGNIIGLNAAGNAPLPNAYSGITLAGSNNTIGGIGTGEANRISFNGGAGIDVTLGNNNLMQGNSIFSNNGLGIDLGSVSGITANDPNDADSGANNLQNFPVLTMVSSGGGGTTIQGTLNSQTNTIFRIDFYSNGACDPSGNGEGARFFDTTNVTTDANGNASINFISSVSLAPGRVLSATATDPSGNVSEFSACDSTNLSGSVQFSAAKYDVLEDVGNAIVNVARVGGSKGTLSIDYTTADGTATAGSDYTSVSGTLVFADGETSKTILVPIANDGVTESDETLRLSLTGFADLETLGSYPVATIVIHENSTPLQLYALDFDVVEGDFGTTDVVVSVYLTAQTSRPVSVDYNTQAFTAASGVDFMPVSGTLNFGPGETLKTISVPIIGDTLDEFHQDFAIVLTNAVNATIIYYPTIWILDDDPLTSVSITDVMVNEGNSGTPNAVFNVSLSAPSEKPVRVSFNIADGTASSGADYTSTSGTVNFGSGQTSTTITVPIKGDTTVEPNETFFVNVFMPLYTTISKPQGVGTILDDDGQTPLQLILEPSSNQVAAVDSLLLVREPFTVLSRAQWWNLGVDPNTRVVVFVQNLQLNQGETASAVEINLVSGSFTATIAAEDVRSLPNTDLTQVAFRLPDNLPAGICVVSVKVHGQFSNTGIIFIGQ